jgi:hypothetical protein
MTPFRRASGTGFSTVPEYGGSGVGKNEILWLSGYFGSNLVVVEF